MKDWFDRNKCIRVFDVIKKQEAVVLHSEDCIENNPCTDLPQNFVKEGYFTDTHGMAHLKVSKYMKSKTVMWDEMWTMVTFIMPKMS